MQRRALALAAALPVIVAAALALWGWQAPSAAALTLKPAPMVRTLQISARVATASRVKLGSTFTGRVLEVAVREGALVEQGQMLLRLESDELQAALAQAAQGQAAARVSGLRSTRAQQRTGRTGTNRFEPRCCTGRIAAHARSGSPGLF